jgi:hypothetical protein
MRNRFARTAARTRITACLLVLFFASSVSAAADPAARHPHTCPAEGACWICDSDSSPTDPELIEGLEREEDITAREEPAAELDSWLKWGGDFRYRMYVEKNIRLDADNPRTDRRFWHRPRVRLWGEVRPIEDLSVRGRVLFAPRYFCEPDLNDQFIFDEAIIDQLYLRTRNTLGMPLTVTVGRQDIELGDGWLLREGTPRDGGRSFYFDAIRATFDHEPSESMIDLVYIQQYADSAKYIRPFNDFDRDLVEQDEKGAVLYVSNTAMEKTRIDGYFIYKHGDKVLSRGYDADLYTFGGLTSGERGQWRYKFELAYQFGNKDGESVSALGSNNRLAYCLGDAWKTRLYFDYEYRSGDEESESHFDMLWGRYTQFSNLYNYYISVLEGQMANASNLHRFGPGVIARPVEAISLALGYNVLFRDCKSDDFDSQGEFRGQLVTARAEYALTKNCKLRVLYDLFLPDSFYGPRDAVASFLQIQWAYRW